MRRQPQHVARLHLRGDSELRRKQRTAVSGPQRNVFPNSSAGNGKGGRAEARNRGGRKWRDEEALLPAQEAQRRVRTMAALRRQVRPRRAGLFAGRGRGPLFHDSPWRLAAGAFREAGARRPGPPLPRGDSSWTGGREAGEAGSGDLLLGPRREGGALAPMTCRVCSARTGTAEGF